MATCNDLSNFTHEEMKNFTHNNLSHKTYEELLFILNHKLKEFNLLPDDIRVPDDFSNQLNLFANEQNLENVEIPKNRKLSKIDINEIIDMIIKTVNLTKAIQFLIEWLSNIIKIFI